MRFLGLFLLGLGTALLLTALAGYWLASQRDYEFMLSAAKFGLFSICSGAVLITWAP